mmetsp:Transcript_51585/g.154867  ORF Transcript_51585/g.154867 Transcript_51585/m.154867 type:complete len:217 (-) Transcript_51585:2291-2941(-)
MGPPAGPALAAGTVEEEGGGGRRRGGGGGRGSESDADADADRRGNRAGDPRISLIRFDRRRRNAVIGDGGRGGAPLGDRSGRRSAPSLHQGATPVRNPLGRAGGGAAHQEPGYDARRSAPSSRRRAQYPRKRRRRRRSARNTVQILLQGLDRDSPHVRSPPVHRGGVASIVSAEVSTAVAALHPRPGGEELRGEPGGIGTAEGDDEVRVCQRHIGR